MNDTRVIKNFTDLVAWKEGHKLVLMIYSSTRNFPKEEIFGLTSQIRRAAVSVTSNIAEGFSRNSNKDKLQFYYICLGSVCELQSQILIAKDVSYLLEDQYIKLTDQSIVVQKLINGMIKKMKSFILDT